MREVIVLDTHAWLWWVSDPQRLSARALHAIEEADVLGVSSMSCWEATRLVLRGRLEMPSAPAAWIANALALPRIELIDVSSEIAVAAALLDWDHGDPCDRIIVATASSRNAPLISKDHRIRAFKRIRSIW